MINLEGIGLRFKESMSGWVGVGSNNFVDGRVAGQREDTPARIDAEIIIDDLDRFIKSPDHLARLKGTFTFKPLGENLAINDGSFNLFSIDPASGVRQMVYSFRCTGNNGKGYFFCGYKEVKDDPGFDITDDMTTLLPRSTMGPIRARRSMEWGRSSSISRTCRRFWHP